MSRRLVARNPRASTIKASDDTSKLFYSLLTRVAKGVTVNANDVRVTVRSDALSLKDNLRIE